MAYYRNSSSCTQAKCRRDLTRHSRTLPTTDNGCDQNMHSTTLHNGVKASDNNRVLKNVDIDTNNREIVGNKLECKSSASLQNRSSNDLEKVDANFDAEELLTRLSFLVPRYFGTQMVEVGLETRHEFIRLENLTAGFLKPCVLDVKIGKVTSDPEADAAKRDYEENKYPWGDKLGFRFLGMQTYNSKTDRFERRDKSWGKTVPDTQIVNCLAQFFSGHSTDYILRVADSFLREIDRIERFFEAQTQFHFYSSSLLLIYEGLTDQSPVADTSRLRPFSETDQSSCVEHSADVLSPNACCGATNGVTVNDQSATSTANGVQSELSRDFYRLKMIDFSHLFPSPGQRDENYLHGLRSFRDYFCQFIRTLG